MIGRNYIYTGNTSPEEDYLSYFMDSALAAPPDEALDGEEAYLSLFMAHSLESADGYGEVVSPHDAAEPEMKFSRFVSGLSQLDADSGVGLIRLSSAVVPTGGFTVSLTDASVLCYSLLGEGELVTDGRELKCRKYDCVWIGGDRRVHLRAAPGKPWECAFIRVHGHPDSVLYAETCRRLRQEGFLSLTFGAGTRFRSYVWQLLSVRTEASPKADDLYHHLLLGLFMEVELAVINASARQLVVPDTIAAIQGYLDTNYPRDISLDELSRLFSISKFHMCREFKRYVGKSPNDYLIDLRLDKAKEMLTDTKRTIAEIGQLVGVPNTNHFLYLFKSREGITPSAFRKQRV
jgi:AraC-like DNA-binding protein